MKQLQEKAKTHVLKLGIHDHCVHPFLRSKRETGERVCVHCGRTIYLVGRRTS
jgi:hypothetical protein